MDVTEAGDLTRLIGRLCGVDTPTVCNAIEAAEGRRGFAGFTRATMVWAGPEEARLFGFARPAHIAGTLPFDEATDVLRARRREYLRAMAAGPRPGLAVVEDDV